MTCCLRVQLSPTRNKIVITSMQGQIYENCQANLLNQKLINGSITYCNVDRSDNAKKVIKAASQQKCGEKVEEQIRGKGNIHTTC